MIKQRQGRWLFTPSKHHRDRGSFIHEPLDPRELRVRAVSSRKTVFHPVDFLAPVVLHREQRSRAPVNINFDTLHAGNCTTVFRRSSAAELAAISGERANIPSRRRRKLSASMFAEFNFSLQSDRRRSDGKTTRRGYEIDQ